MSEKKGQQPSWLSKVKLRKTGRRGDIEAKMKDLESQTRNRRAARKFSRNKDTIQTLLTSLTQNPKFAKMIEYSVTCLKNLAVDEVSIEEMVEEGTIEVLMKIAKLNPYNERIQTLINSVIKSFCINDHIAKLIADRLGDGKMFVFSMEKHKEVKCLTSTCEATAKMFQHKPNIDMVVKAGAIPALGNLVIKHPDSPAMLASAFECLSAIAGHNPKYAAQIYSIEGLMQAILDALKTHGKDLKVALNGLKLLGSLAKNLSPEQLEALKKMGAVDIISSVCELHPENEDILEAGATALRFVADEKDLIGALKIETDTSVLMARMLAKVASLLLVDENVAKMIKHKGVEWLLAALRKALESDTEVALQVLMSGCRALGRLCTNETNVYAVLKAGGVALMVAIINKHKGNEPVLLPALGTLTKMATRKENCAYIAQSGGIHAVIAALSALPASIKVAQGFLTFCAAMGKDDSMVPVLVKNNVFLYLISTLKRFMATDVGIATKCVEQLKRLCCNETNTKYFGQCKGIGVLMTAMEGQKNDEAFCLQALLLAETCAYAKDNISLLRAANAIGIILDVMAIHEDNTQIQTIGSRALAMIAGKEEIEKSVGRVSELALKVTKTPLLAPIKELVTSVRFLGNLALISGNIETLIKAGGVQALIKAFQAAYNLSKDNSSRERLLAMAVQGIVRLNKDPQSSIAVVEGEIMSQALQVALAATGENAESLAMYAAQLAFQCAAVKDNVARMLKEGAIESLIALANLHPLNEKLLAAVAGALGCLAVAGGKDALARIVKAGGCKVVVEAIFANLDNPRTLVQCLNALRQLATSPEAVKALVEAGALDAIVAAMRKHKDKPAVLAACVGALCALLISEEIATQAGQKGVLPLMIGIFRVHYREQKLCEVNMVCLDSLASVYANTKRLLAPKLGTIKLVEWVAKAYVKNQTLSKAAQRLLASLRRPSPEELERRRREAERKRLQAENEDMRFDEARCDVMVRQLYKGSDDERMVCVKKLQKLTLDATNAKIFTDRGGLEALAALLKGAGDNEDLFYQAADLFMQLVENGGEDVAELLEKPEIVDALCLIMDKGKSKKDFDLSASVKACARMKMTPSLMQQLMQANPIETLMQIMATSEDVELLTQAARLLGKLTNSESIAAAFCKDVANIRQLIQAMRKNMENEGFLKYAVYMLGSLAQLNENVQKQIGIESGVQVILEVMKRYIQVEAVVENCNFALANLTYKNTVNCTFVTALEGVELILASLQTHSSAEELLDSGICTLCNVCSGKNNPSRDAVVRAGGAQVVTDIVLANFQALDMLVNAFRLLGTLAHNKKSIAKVIEAGAVQGIVAGITVHAEELGIIHIAIRVLTNLSSVMDPKNMAIMSQEGAVQAVVEVASKYTDKLDIEVAAVGCLVNLSREEYNAGMIVKHGGVESVVEALKKLAGSATFVHKANVLLANLCYKNKNVPRVLDAGACRAVVGSMDRYQDNVTVLPACLSALKYMAYSAESAHAMAIEGPIKQCLAVMKLHMRTPPIVSDCFGSLSALCRAEPNAVSMAPMGMKRVNEVCQLYGSTKELKPVLSGFKFLANLAVHKKAGDALCETHLTKTILDTLAGKFQETSFVLRGLRALENLAYGSREVKAAMRSDRIETALDALEKSCSDRDDVVRACKAVIDALNRQESDYKSMPFMSLKPQDMKKRSAMDIFGERENKIDGSVLPDDVRNLLCSGALLTKHSKSSAPKPRHVYIDPELTFLVWKDPKKPLHPDNKMKIYKIRSVEPGRATPQLQRKKTLGGYYAKEECAFAIIARDRTVDLECKTEQDRDRWVNAIRVLLAWRKKQKEIASKFSSR